MEGCLGRFQVADGSQDLADILSAPVLCASPVYLAQPLYRRLDRDPTARAGAPLFRVGSAGGVGERAGQSRALSRPALEPGDSAAYAVSRTLLLRLDLPH